MDHTGRTGEEAGRGAGGEFAAIEQVRRLLAARLGSAPTDEVWIGDDCAVVRARGGLLLLTSDLSVAGVHADLEVMGLEDLGWRALVAALSDIAAMGGVAADALVSVAGPPSTDLGALYEGIASAARVHSCSVVGGDLSTAGQLVVSVSASGWVSEGPPPVLRSGAHPGDRLLVTGPLGASAAGLRALRGAGAPPDELRDQLVKAHLRPTARLEAGRVARMAGASAMIDVSDGLAADLGHLADASGVGFELGELPVAPGALLTDALEGGEDYELVIAMSDDRRLADEYSRAGIQPPILIGRCTADPARRTFAGEPIVARGYEHPWRRPTGSFDP